MQIITSLYKDSARYCTLNTSKDRLSACPFSIQVAQHLGNFRVGEKTIKNGQKLEATSNEGDLIGLSLYAVTI